MTDEVSEARSAADRAAESLAAEGVKVTARAVRSRAGVQMAVAAEVAREWKAREDLRSPVPEIPDVVQIRMEGLWAEAVRAARSEHDYAVNGWQSQIHQLEAERDEAIAAADEQAVAARVEQDQAQTTITELRTHVERLTAAAQEAQAQIQAMRDERSQAREEAAEARGQVSVLREQLQQLQPHAEGGKPRKTQGSAKS